jgi:hypothetical protein
MSSSIPLLGLLGLRPGFVTTRPWVAGSAVVLASTTVAIAEPPSLAAAVVLPKTAELVKTVPEATIELLKVDIPVVLVALIVPNVPVNAVKMLPVEREVVAEELVK